MHVLMISDVFFPRVNGVSTSIATFRESLRELGVRSTLVAPDYAQRCDGDDAGLRRVPAWTVPLDPEDRLMRPRALARALDSVDPGDIDLVHIQTPFLAHGAGVRYARRHGLPVIETYHTHFEEYFHHYLPWLPRTVLRFAARAFSRRQCEAVDAVIVPSLAMQDVLRGYGVRRPIEILPTGIDLARFDGGDGARFRRTHGIGLERPVMVLVSRVAHEKNIDFLVEVTDRLRVELPDVLLLIAGEGPAEAHLRSLVEQRGLGQHVRFVGYLARDGALQDCFCAGDLFAFASRSETQGLVLLEALALGVPVIALAELGTREIVLPERGARAAPDDPAGFAALAATLLRDPPLRARLAAEGRAFAREWDTGAIARRVHAFYSTRLASRVCYRSGVPAESTTASNGHRGDPRPGNGGRG
jgi:glycosyltransferase involved in cell wall biosynthesis